MRLVCQSFCHSENNVLRKLTKPDFKKNIFSKKGEKLPFCFVVEVVVVFSKTSQIHCTEAELTLQTSHVDRNFDRKRMFSSV